MTLYSIAALIFGLIFLAVGAEYLVRGAVSLAKRLGVPLLVIGLTIVAWGTSAPELVVSVEASLTGHPGVSIGNLVGSNIANFMLIGGLCACLIALGLSRAEFRRDGLVLILSTVLFVALFLDRSITWWKGIILLAVVIGYSIWVTLDSIRSNDLPEELTEDVLSWFGSAWRVVLGAVLLAAGGKLLVDGSVDFAKYLGVDEAVIGMTVVAVGTSLPELAASLAAVRQRQPEVVIGNLIGSNVYNIMAIMGVVALISGGNTAMPADVVGRDMWVMAGSTFFVLAIIGFWQKLPRFVGPILLLGYGGFLVTQVVSVL